MLPPKLNACARKSNHVSSPLGSSVESRVAEKSAYKVSDLIRIDGKHDQAIPWVAKISSVKAEVASKKCGRSNLVQKWNDLLIEDTFFTDLVTDLLGRNPPAA